MAAKMLAPPCASGFCLPRKNSTIRSTKPPPACEPKAPARWHWLFCIGPMTVIGGLQNGLTGDSATYPRQDGRFGRDVLSKAIKGTQVSVFVGVMGAAIRTGHGG